MQPTESNTQSLFVNCVKMFSTKISFLNIKLFVICHRESSSVLDVTTKHLFILL